MLHCVPNGTTPDATDPCASVTWSITLEQQVAKLNVDDHRLCILIQAMPVRHAAVKNQLQDVRRMLPAAGRAGGGLRSQPVGDTAVSGPAVSCLGRSLQR